MKTIISSHTVKYISPFIAFILIIHFSSCEQRDFERILKVTTDSIINEETSIMAQGTVIDAGENGITDHGHCWSTQPNPTIENEKSALGGKNERGMYLTSLFNLVSDSTYYVRSYIQYLDEIVYGNEISFVYTKPDIATVRTGAVLCIDLNTIIVSGDILNTGTRQVDDFGFCWSLNNVYPTPETDKKISLGTTSDTQVFSSLITNVSADTIYIRSYAINKMGSSYGKTMKFGTYIPGKNISMVEIGQGYFSMGDDFTNNADESPAHTVHIDRVYMSKYEITNSNFADFLNTAPSGLAEIGLNGLDLNAETCKIQKLGDYYFPCVGYEDFPVVNITWYGANGFCQWISGRLPTEAEWEYAARGGNNSNNFIYSGANVADFVGWHKYLDGEIHQKGLKLNNELGIADMSGNAMEWCSDFYGRNYYSQSPESNPTGPLNGNEYVLRGGAFDQEQDLLRNTARQSAAPSATASNIGFRIVHD